MQPNGGRWWQATGLGLILLTGAGLVAWAEQNDSGQNQCYDGHDMVACTEATSGDQAPHPRQDGRYGRDAQGEQLTKTGGGLAGFDFTPLDAQGQPIPLLEGVPVTPPACTRDNLTGLTWEIKTQDRGLRDQDWTYADPQTPGDPCGASLGAQGCDPVAYGAAVNAQGLCGAQDWRLPSVTELRSLVDAGGFDPALDAAYFPHSPSGPYRTATPGPGPGQSWVVHFRDGQATPAPNDQPQHLRLVRGPGAPPSSHAASGDGTISQTPSGLIWAPCSEGQSLPGCLGQARPMTWAEALLTARGAELAGYRDWRLPSRVELATLVDCDRQGPAIDGAHFPNTPPAPYWTSTSLMADPSQAWSIDFQDGADQAQDKQSLGYLRLVRAGTIDGLAITDTQDPAGDIPSAPAARTGSASVVTAANAWITGTVDDRGSVTQVRFDYGPTDRYGATITANPTSLGAGSGATAVNATLSGLSCGTQYHYRVKAESAAGTSTGEDQRFTTSACAAGDALGNRALLSQADGPQPRDAAGCGSNWQVVNPAPQGNTLVAVAYGNGIYVAVGEFGTILTSLDGNTWTVRTSPTGQWLPGVTWNGSQFVIVGGGGTILTSSNGESWTWQNSGTLAMLRDVSWNGNQFVVVPWGYFNGSAWDPAITLTSTNGINWAINTIPDNKTNWLNSIVWAAGRFVAVGFGGKIVTSTNGVDWALEIPYPTGELLGIAWNGSGFVTVGTSGTILTSPDATVWQSQTSGQPGDLWRVAWSGSQFVAVGNNGTILTSPDGVSWTVQVSGTTQNLNGVTWSGSQFVAVGEGGTILTSTCSTPILSTQAASEVHVTGATLNGTVNANGADAAVSFEYGLTPSYGQQSVAVPATVSAGAGTFSVSTEVVGLNCGTSYHYRVQATNTGGTNRGGDATFTTAACPSTSSCGASWQANPAPPSAAQAVAYGQGTFVAVGNGGAVLTSLNGANWTAQTPTTAMLIGVTWSGSQFVAVGTAGTILTSPDGTTWTQQTSNTAQNLYDVRWSGSQFVAVGENGTLLTSPNGSVWTTRTSGVAAHLFGVAWGANRFVVTGAFGVVLTSTDGITWTTQTSGTSNHLWDVAWSGSQFVAVGWAGTILTSLDGITWVPQTSPTGNNLWGVTWSGTEFVAVGDSLTILTSSDGVTWANRSIGMEPLSSVAWDGSQFVAVGAWGTVLSSTCAPTVSTQAPSGISASGATMNGTANANGADAVVSFDHGATTSYGANSAATPGTVSGGTGSTAVSAALTGLTCNTTRHYRVKATNSFRTSHGSDQSVTTAACVPSAVTQAASGIGASGATLNGTVNAEGADATVSFDYGPTISYGSSLAATPGTVGAVAGSTTISANLAGLTCNTTYHYRAKGVNSAGTGTGGDQTFTTGACAPTATTSTPSTITASGATLNGTVNANGADATVSFEYGSTTSYGSSLGATPGTVGASAGDTVVSASLSGLTCNTTYHYRVTASNSAGTSHGLDESFTTSACPVTPPTATTQAATGISQVQATLRGTVNDNGATTTVSFEWGETNAYGSTLTASPSSLGAGSGSTAVSGVLGGLVPNRTYHYRVRAENVGGVSNGGDQSFTTVGYSDASLSVTLGGGGQGRVTSNPVGIDCGADCSQSYPGTTLVSLTAQADPGSRFTGWSGACGGTSPTCFVNLVYGSTATAIFEPEGVSTCGVDWQWVNPLPQGNYILSVAYGNGVFVTVGGYGTILTSPDGVSWTAGTSGTGNELRGVTWSGSQFVAVGGNGTILTSLDGESWTARASGTTQWLFGVTWSGSQFVAVGSGGAILTSGDGATWTAQSSGTGQYLLGVTWSGSQFVAVGGYGTILTSPDGATWAARTSGAFADLYDVTWSGSQFVAVGSGGKILTSPDGATWTGHTSGTNDWLYGVTWSGSQFVAVGGNGTILTSPDGATWAARTSGAFADLYDVTWSGSQFVAVGSGGKILTSPDGATWTGHTSGTNDWLYGVTWSGSQFVAVGGNGTILTSPDGATWTARTSGTNSWLYGVTWSGSQFVAVGWNGTILTSPNGETWTARASGTGQTLFGVTWSGSQFVVVGESGPILTSPDGETWTARSSGTGQILFGVTWSGSRLVAVGAGEWNGPSHDPAPILTSPDGVTWTARTSGTSNDLYGVTWSGSQWVAVGGFDAILTSPDGVSWAAQSSGTEQDLKGVAWSGSQFVAVGSQGTILTSPDGVTWTVRTSGTTNYLEGVTWSGSQFVAVGSSGTILTSACVPAPSAPTATTQAATSITASGATLNGTVNANGADASVSFDYGLTTSYGDTLAGTPATVGASAGDTGVSASLSGLTCNSTYHYRVTATNSVGTTQGLDESFTTAACPVTAPGATTDAATGIGQTQAQLNGTVNDNGAATAVSFEWGETLAYGRTLSAIPATLSAGAGATAVTNTLGGLLPNQTYHYRVRAENSSGVSYGGDQSFTTGSYGNATLTVTKGGAGQGQISSNPAGIDCGSDCSETYPQTTLVTLTATPEAGSVFGGWTGACGGSASACTLNLIYDQTVTAAFDPAGESRCGVDWQWANPLPQANPLRGIAHGNGTLVAVGDYGTILTSGDGATWTAQSSGTGQHLFGVAWSGSQFVAVGSQGTILTSPDGETWTAQSSGAWQSLWGVTWSGSRFAAVGEYGAILTSPDGVSWTARASGAWQTLLGVTWSGSQFVAVGVSGTILTSPDGVSWTGRTSGTTSWLLGVTWSGSQFVAVGSQGTILTSPDGVSWAAQSSWTAQYLRGVAWSGSQFVAVGEYGAILTSPDGVSWTAQSSGTGQTLYGVTWSGSQFVAVGSQGTILTSPDGETWTAQLSGTTQWLWRVTWSGSQFVVVGDYGTILTSPDGATWTAQSSGTEQYLRGIAWSGSQWVAVGSNGAILTSPDGASWTAQTSGTGQTLLGVTWSGSQFVAVGLYGAILTSPDGVSWTVQSSGTEQHLWGVAWSGSQWVAVGFGGTILTSPDGATWTAQVSGTGQYLLGVTWSGSQFVAVGFGGTILTSSDGETWTAQSSGTGQTLYGVTWSGSQFVAVGWNGTILTSPDGVTWTAQASGTGHTLLGVTWSGSQFVAVGDYGTILRSTCSGVTTPTAPTATSAAATEVTATGATLNGTVNANGAEASVSFDYGLTTSYGDTLAGTPGTVGASAGDTAVSASLSGLTCNSTYHYRVTATNSAGTSQGLDETFTTAACPATAPTATTSAATSVTATAATLNGTLTPNGATTTASFDYGPTTSYGSSLAATPGSIGGTDGSTAVSASLTGLTCNTTYHYQVMGLNSAGTGLGGDQSFTTGACSATCTPGAILMNTPTTLSGVYRLSSEQSITTSASVQVQTGADVTFAAPSIRLGPGFRVALGAKFRAEAHAVTCP